MLRKKIVLIILGILSFVFVYILYTKISYTLEKRNAQQEFVDLRKQVTKLSEDNLILQTNADGEVRLGDGRNWAEDCFLGEAELIFGTNHPFEVVVQDYQTGLDNLGYSVTFLTELKGTSDEREVYVFSKPELTLFMKILNENLDNLSQYEVEFNEYNSYYRIGIRFQYPSESRCLLRGY